SIDSPAPALHADGNLAVLEDLQLGDLHAHADHAGQLHQAARELADQALEQVHMLGGALVDDDLAHLAVVEHMADVVVLGQQRLCALVELGVDLDRLRRGDLVVEDAQVGLEAQAGEGEDLVAGGVDGHGGPHMSEKSRSKRIRCWPPSTSSVVPVIEPLSSAKATAAATSAGVDERPRGDCWCSCWNFSSVSRWLVSVSPGATPTTRTRGARASASMVLAASSAALDRV